MQSAWGDALQAVKKIYLKKEQDTYFLCIDFDEQTAFVPRILTLPRGVKLLLSFNGEVKLPVSKKISHPVINGCFFERFSPSSLMFILGLKDEATFISKRYTQHSIKIAFKIKKKRVIVIDAGHGGKDPGTRGIMGNAEKEITLVTAIELRNTLVNSSKYHVILTRDKDEFVSINERRAKTSTGDILISLHTDSNEDRKLRGMSVYTLPDLNNIKRTADNATNNADTYNAILQRSRKFSQKLINYIPDICKIKSRPCRNSELKILKTAIPAVLIELGCVSNKTDNELLYSQVFRTRIVNAIQYALDDFFEKE